MAERIKERRTLLGFTQEELASQLGLQKSAIAKYENGRVENMKRSMIIKMSSVLECSPAYLMGWENTLFPVQHAPSQEELSSDEGTLLASYRKLTDLGKKKAREYTADLSDNPKYAKTSSPLLQAAHERTDIEVTDGARKHDDAIMADDREWE